MRDIQHSAIFDLRQILSQHMIPWVSSDKSMRIILAQRPLLVPADMSVKRRPAPGLKINHTHRSHLFLGEYPQEGMHAIRYPYLCYVVEGEIDIRLGIPAKHGHVSRYEIVTIPQHNALLIPPGVFFPDGKSTYWERAGSPADARMFWVHILPTGVFCHSSATRHGLHTSNNLDVFVPGQHFATLIELLKEDMQSTGNEAIMVARNTLLLFFSRIQWKLSEGTQATITSGLEMDKEKNSQQRSHSLTIQRACDFIRKHNDTSFTVEEVATYAYVSPSHLMRLFRTEMGMTVMEYTLKQRFAVAKAWLISSKMPIKQIAKSLGYSQTPQFNRIFKQMHGISPTEFRRRNHH